MTQKLAFYFWVPVLSVSLVAQQAPQAPAPDATAPAAAQTPTSSSGQAANSTASPADNPATPGQAADAPASPPPPDTLVDGTPVRLHFMQTVSSADARVGQQVSFEVMDDINVSGATVIKKGSTAIGIVTEAVPHQSMGRPGKLAIGISSVRLADEEKAPLRGNKKKAGIGVSGVATGAAVATGATFVFLIGLAFPPLLAAEGAFFFIHGKNNSVPAGTELIAYTDGDMHLSMAKFTAAPLPAASPETASTDAAMPAAPIAPAADSSDQDQALNSIQDVGVYAKDKTGQWNPIEVETVTFKTSSTLKKIESAHIMKGDIDGSVSGPRAKLTANLPFTFAVFLPENETIAHYELIRFHAVGDSRQFRSVVGGMINASAEKTRDAIEFQPEKISTRLYLITIERVLGKGEYGLLAPGTNAPVGSAKETTGKIYAVSVTE
jgi:hypothetical protein